MSYYFVELSDEEKEEIVCSRTSLELPKSGSSHNLIDSIRKYGGSTNGNRSTNRGIRKEHVSSVLLSLGNYQFPWCMC